MLQTEPDRPNHQADQQRRDQGIQTPTSEPLILPPANRQHPGVRELGQHRPRFNQQSKFTGLVARVIDGQQRIPGRQAWLGVEINGVPDLGEGIKHETRPGHRIDQGQRLWGLANWQDRTGSDVGGGENHDLRMKLTGRRGWHTQLEVNCPGPSEVDTVVQSGQAIDRPVGDLLLMFGLKGRGIIPRIGRPNATR